MATHDYVIDNSTGANVRTDINNVLQAILTNNSSSSAPSTTAAYMWWADTTNGILKIRNSANNAWVELLQLDGTLTLEDGTKTAPALAHRSNLNTGIFFSAANKFNISTAGVERLELGTETIFNEEGADVDFRIEGDSNVNLFYLDAGNDRIGIGTNVPSSSLEISVGDSGTTSSAGFNEFSIEGGNEDIGMCFLSPAANNRTQTIAFGDSNNNSSGKIEYNHSTDDLTLTASDNIILSGDAVGIGTTSPDQLLHLAAASNGPFIRFENTDTTVSSDQTFGGLEFESRDTSAGSAGVIAKIDCISSAAFDGTSANGGELRFHTSGTNSISLQERIRIDATGNVGIGTTSPSEKLHLYQDATDNVLALFEQNTANQGNLLSFKQTTTGSVTRTAYVGHGGDATGNLMLQNSGGLILQTDGSNTALAIDTSQNVGIGTTSPGHKLHLKGTDTAYGGSVAVGAILELEDAAGRKSQLIAPGAVGEAGVGTPTNHQFTLFTNNTERIRINTSGHVLFNCTSLPSASVAGAGFEKNGDQAILFSSSGSSTASSNHAEFKNGNGTMGTINTNGSTCSYNDLSDYRLKENQVAISDGITRLKTLKPYRFNFKTDASTTIDGFFAHEVTAVPEAVTGTKDAVDSDNNPVYQFIDRSKLVPLLTAALQEAISKIETLETKVAALEAA